MDDNDQQQQQQQSTIRLWKKSPSSMINNVMVDNMAVSDSTGSIINLTDLSESNAAFIGTICLASGFILLALFATIYYYRKRSLYQTDFVHGTAKTNDTKILLLQKDLKFSNEKPYKIGKTPAVRSPNSSSGANSGNSNVVINPFQKKSPSPTGGLSPNDEMKNVNSLRNLDLESGSVGGNNRKNSQSSCNSSKHCSPINEEPITAIKSKSSASPTTTTESKVSNVDVDNKQISSSTTTNQTMATTTTNNNATMAVKNLGKLHFKLKYSYEKRALCLVINRCTDLQAKDSNNNSTLDPYVKMQLLPEKQHKAKTRVLRKSLNPIYNEEFTFYGITSNLLENLIIHFVVLNFDRFSRDEILGETFCRLNQFEFDSLEKQLTLCQDLVPVGNKLKIHDLGELLVSLCYQPIANRLTVVILKARNLPKMDLTGLCDPYVKIYLFHNQERISKKRTHIKRRTLSPVFNESFIFDIPSDECLDNIHLKFLIYDHDRVTRNEFIGKVEIGSKTGIQTTEKHWHEVIKSPRRQIAEWHRLTDDNNNSGGGDK
uniref:Synaptotagmin-4-like isoform X2 n=1 Tax=Dermatophagoides pteronyssinus TaxID=6956 RepID=A0A6P6YHD1_DERPT|nr:synaptotagmin-4-like isoform X2 [Dermatophagoides pteronyssinus]